MSTATKNGVVPGLAELDLDDILGAIDVAPRPVKLGGRLFHVRRDLTGEQAVECLRLIRSDKELEATGMLLEPAEDAVALDALLKKLPAAHTRAASARILQIAGILAGDGDLGESPAS